MTMSRTQRRALTEMAQAPVSPDGQADPSRVFNKALVIAWQGECDCHTCRLLRKAANSLFGAFGEDDDDLDS